MLRLDLLPTPFGEWPSGGHNNLLHYIILFFVGLPLSNASFRPRPRGQENQGRSPE